MVPYLISDLHVAGAKMSLLFQVVIAIITINHRHVREVDLILALQCGQTHQGCCCYEPLNFKHCCSVSITLISSPTLQVQ